MRSKFYFSQWKTCFSWFIAKFLKFVVISHSLCYIWNVKRLILCKLPILCSTVKLKLGYSFPNSSIDAKLGFLSVDLIQTGKVGHWIRAYSSLAWADYSTVSPTWAAFYSYLVLQVSLIACHGTMSVLICVYWCKSRSETC